MENVLIKEEKYSGSYVAIKNFTDPIVIGSGKEPIDALNMAKSKGYENPYIVFVPQKGMVQIY